MTTIGYDRPVKDLISGLDATGHVTHTKHRKTMVTLHHNGGVLSHEDVLNVWRVRPASAHFNVDSAGTVAQYVRTDEYAWACGNTTGNQTSISIEMCNQSGPPGWVVGDATWKSAARLAGWLFARVIGTRPTSSNLVRHKYWSATACAGPFIDQVYGQMLQIAQQTYDAVTSGRPDEQPDQTTKSKGADDMLIKKLTGEGTGQYALVSGGILSGTDTEWSAQTGEKTGVLGVSDAVWDDMVRKSQDQEAIAPLLREVLAELKKFNEPKTSS